VKYVCAVLAAAGFLVLAPGAGHAQDRAQREQARLHFQQGVRAAQESRWPDAIQELEAARAIRANAAVHFNLGLAYRAVGRNHDAIASFEEFLRVAGPRVPPARGREARGYVQTLRAGIAQLLIAVTPADAAVAVDGTRVASLDAPHRVDPGRHVVVVDALGFRTASRVVAVRPGARERLSVQLERLPENGRIVVESDPPHATVAVDGQAIGRGVVERIALPGSHAVDVQASGRRPFHRDFAVAPGQVVRVRAMLEPTSRPSVVRSPLFWTGVGAGVVAVVAVVVVAVAATAREGPYPARLGVVYDALTAPR
jgi:hypothetical protein